MILSAVDFSSKSVKELLQCATTADPPVQVKALDELTARWVHATSSHATSPPHATSSHATSSHATSSSPDKESVNGLVGELRVHRGLKGLLACAVEARLSVDPALLPCQARLSKFLALLTSNSMLLFLCYFFYYLFLFILLLTTTFLFSQVRFVCK